MPPPGGIPKKRVVKKKMAVGNPDAADRNAEARNVKSTATSTPVTVDRNRDARHAPTPAVVQKERVFAHPSRPNNRRVIRKAARAQAKSDYDATQRARRVKEDRAETRRVVSKIDAHPTPSPDALDTVRSPQQKESDAEFTAKNIKTIRQRIVAKRGSLAITRGVKKELEGKGELAKVLGKLGDNAAKKSGGTGAGLTFAAIPGQRHSGSKAGEITANAYKDLVNLPAQVIPSVYVPVAAAVEAAQGHTDRAKKFAKDIDESDPIYNLAAAGVNAAKGNLPAAGKRLRKARDAAEEHPGFAVAEAVGFKGTIGRGIGTTTRHVGAKAEPETIPHRRGGGRPDVPNPKAAGKRQAVRRVAARVGSKRREASTLPGTSLREERTYSPDTFKKAGQVVVEKTRSKYAKHVRRLGDEAKARGETEHATDLHEKAVKIDPVKPVTEKQILRRVDEHVDAMETVRRMHRGEVVNETRAAVKEAGADKAGPVASLVTQGIVHADPADIRAYISEIKGEFTGLSNHGKRANKQLVKGLETALKDHGKGKVDFGELEKLAADYRVKQADRETALHERGMIGDEEAAMAAAKPYAVRRMEAKWDDKAGLVDKHGDPLTLTDIRDHMKAHDEPVPSWLSQAPNSRGARNFFQSSTRAPHISTQSRTGEAVRGGTFDAHPDTLVEGAARQQTLKDAFDGFHAFLDEFGLKGKGGKIKTVLTKKQADNAIREAMVDEHGDPRPGAIKWVAVRANPLGGRSDQLAKMLEGTDNAVGGKSHIDDAIHAALGGDGEGPWAIVPEAAASRLQEHVRVLNPGNAGKIAQKANSNFRKTVLSTSIPWLTGNVVEGGARATLAGAGPRSWSTGRRVLKQARTIDKELGERSTARTVGGGHYGSVERQHTHLNVDAMKPGAMKTIAKSLGAFWRAPGPKHVADLWHGYTHVVMNTVNRAIETQIQTAMLGKAVHDSELMDAPLMRASEAAVDKAARGVLDQNTAVALGRQLDIMYGKYGKWSPDMRKQVALYTPFVAWTLNATYFILRTMPRDHPTTTALIAATENATDEWRKDHGLDKFIAGALPAWLQGSIPGGGGTHYRAPGRYTPFGLGADPLGAYAGAVLPMLTGVIAAGKGKDWQGHDLPDQSDGGKAKAAVTSILDASVPFLALGKRVAEKGVKAATVDATAGKVAPAKRKRAVSRRSSSKPGQIVGPGSSGGKIVGAGTSGGGKIVR